ncbi:MAG: SDR family NAD(P)-dependent oxidoreductase, partial [Gammaproteobacteria bacterium]
MLLRGQHAVVTGGGTGLGAAVAEELAGAGAKVVVLGRRQDVVARQAAKIGGLGLSCDIADAAQTERAFRQGQEAFGPVRVLVGCAAITRAYPLVDKDGKPATLVSFTEMIAINLSGAYNAIRLAAASMIASDPVDADGSRGVIINVSSCNADYCAIPGAAGYVASKGALNAMTTQLAIELAPHGIRVVTVSAGPFATQNLFDTLPPESLEWLKQNFLFPKRLGDPLEFAQMVRFVCENNFVNRTILR